MVQVTLRVFLCCFKVAQPFDGPLLQLPKPDEGLVFSKGHSKWKQWMSQHSVVNIVYNENWMIVMTLNKLNILPTIMALCNIWRHKIHNNSDIRKHICWDHLVHSTSNSIKIYLHLAMEHSRKADVSFGLWNRCTSTCQMYFFCAFW